MRVLKAGMIAIASLVAVGALAGTLSAQGNGGNPVLQAIQSLQDTVNNLVTTVNGINASTTPGNVLFTPSVFVDAPDSATCTATNVSTAPRSVTVQLFNSQGPAPILLSTSIAAALAPGVYIASTHSPATSARVACTVTVTDGTKNDVRAAIALYTGSGSDKDMLAAQ